MFRVNIAGSCTVFTLEQHRYYSRGNEAGKKKKRKKNKIQPTFHKFNAPFQYITIIYIQRYSRVCTDDRNIFSMKCITRVWSFFFLFEKFISNDNRKLFLRTELFVVDVFAVTISGRVFKINVQRGISEERNWRQWWNILSAHFFSGSFFFFFVVSVACRESEAAIVSTW